MEYSYSNNEIDIKKYIKYFFCLKKKILLLKNKKDKEYLDNIAKCENFINIVYPEINILIKNISINKNDINKNREDINKLYNLGELYKFKNI